MGEGSRERGKREGDREREGERERVKEKGGRDSDINVHVAELMYMYKLIHTV